MKRKLETYGLKSVCIGTVDPTGIEPLIISNPRITGLGNKMDLPIFHVPIRSEIQIVTPLFSYHKIMPCPVDTIVFERLPKVRTQTLKVLIRNKAFARPVTYIIEIPFGWEKDKIQSLRNYIKMLYNHRLTIKLTFNND